MVFAKIPNLPGNSGRNSFFLHFCKFGCNKDFRCRLIRILLFPLDPNDYFTDYREICEFNKKFRVKIFIFCIFVNSVGIYVFEVADFEYCGFRLTRIMVFAKIPNIPGNSGQNIFFCIFVNSVVLRVFAVA